MKRKELRAELFEKMITEYASKNMVVWKRIGKPHFRIMLPTVTADIYTTGLKYHLIEPNWRGELADLNDAIALLEYLKN
jgi:hypothetical protein